MQEKEKFRNSEIKRMKKEILHNKKKMTFQISEKYKMRKFKELNLNESHA